MLSHIRIGAFVPSIFLVCLPIFSASAQSRPEPLPPLDSLNLTGMQRAVEDLYDAAQEMQWTLEREEPLADSLQALASNQLMLAKMDSTLSKAYVDSLAKVSKEAHRHYKARFDQVVKLGKLRRSLEELPVQDSLNLRKKLPKAWKQTRKLYDEIFPPPPAEKIEREEVAAETAESETPISKSTNQQIDPPTPARRFARYDPALDVMLHPPAPPCVLAAISKDEFSGELTRELARAELFRYTNPALKTYLQGKTHIVCQAAMVSIGSSVWLQLTFTINDPNARKAFGRLDKNSPASFKFMNGSTFIAQNSMADDGTFDPETGATVFQARYPIAADMLKKIRKSELDRLRIAWSNGYEDYDVQQVDLLRRQADCLFK